MKIEKELCISCGECEPVCPVGAILVSEECAEINRDQCVECGVCFRSDLCPTDSFIREDLEWPRIIRYLFSDPLCAHELTKIPGRGTTEMKTNDVTNRFRSNEAGIGVELGRPCLGTLLSEVEKITIPVCQMKGVYVEFQKNNPVTHLIDTKTGRFNDRSILNERVLSAIVELKVIEAEAPKVLRVLRDASEKLSTVCSLEYITRNIENNMISKSIIDILNKEGFEHKPNGKICLGLGIAKGEKN